jgi:hypothetical protein
MGNPLDLEPMGNPLDPEPMGNRLHQHILEVTKGVLVRVLVSVEITDRGQDLHMVEITCMGVLVSILAQVKDNMGTGRYKTLALDFYWYHELINVDYFSP